MHSSSYICQYVHTLVLCTTDPCGPNTMCRDVPNSFVCTCNPGFTGNVIVNPATGCVGKTRISALLSKLGNISLIVAKSPLVTCIF